MKKTTKATVVLSEDLWSRVKSRAALNKETVKVYVARCLEKSLADEKGTK